MNCRNCQTWIPDFQHRTYCDDCWRSFVLGLAWGLGLSGGVITTITLVRWLL